MFEKSIIITINIINLNLDFFVNRRRYGDICFCLNQLIV